MIHDRPANDVIPDECYENTSADINEYRALVAESTTAAAELRLLVQSVRELLAGASDATPRVDALVEAETTVGDRVFLQLVALIFIFFIALLGYRFVAGRLFSR